MKYSIYFLAICMGNWTLEVRTENHTKNVRISIQSEIFKSKLSVLYIYKYILYRKVILIHMDTDSRALKSIDIMSGQIVEYPSILYSTQETSVSV